MANNSEYVRAFSHITGEWLQTETSETGHLLRAGEIGTLRRLRTYLRHPGLFRGTYTNDEGGGNRAWRGTKGRTSGPIVIHELPPELIGTR